MTELEEQLNLEHKTCIELQYVALPQCIGFELQPVIKDDKHTVLL